MTHTTAAKQMFKAAGITPTADEVKVLSADLLSLAQDEFDYGDPTGCVDEEQMESALDCLRSRIGGYGNLRSYVNCLLVHV